MTRKAQPDQAPEAARRRDMARLGGVFAGVGVVTTAGTAGVALALPGPADHVTATAVRRPGRASPRPGHAGGGSRRAGRRLQWPKEDLS